MNVNEIYGLAFTVVFNVGPLIQLRKIVVNKSSVNISLVMWILPVSYTHLTLPTNREV